MCARSLCEIFPTCVKERNEIDYASHYALLKLRTYFIMKNFPFKEVNWGTSSFLIVSFFTALIGVPIYIYHYGLDPFLIFLFVFNFIAAGMSITLGYHRLFSHKAFKAKAPVRLITLLFGASAFEDSALDWSSDHRNHHKFVDQEEDPYDISKGFFWAHMGWIFFKLYPRELPNVNDLRKDKLVMWQHKYHLIIGITVGIITPTILGYLYGGPMMALGGFLIGGITRVVAVQHCTFLINSSCHCIGSQPYDTTNTARDSWIMAIPTFGEGYHNYHHAFQHDYRNGVKAWQLDPTKWAIWILSKIGLVSDLKEVSDEKILLAELRETRNQASEQLEILAKESDSTSDSPIRDAAVEKLQSLSASLQENYSELENAVSEKIDVSREVLNRWQKQASEVLDQVGTVKRYATAKA